MLSSVPDCEGRCALLGSLLVAAERAGKTFTREQLERRMAYVAAAGVTEPEEFKRFVLSGDGA